MVFPPFKTCSQETPKISIAEFVFQNYRKRAAEGKTALIWADKGIAISYDDLLRNAVRAATGLQAMGAKSGDTMALVTRNSPELFYVVIGAMFAGITVAPSVAELSANELRSNFEITRPRYILTRLEKESDVKEALSGLPLRAEIILLEEETVREILAKGAHATPETFQTAEIKDPTQHDFAYLFSSGSTGKQKAITQNDYYFLRNMLLSMMPMLKHSGPFYCASQANWTSWFQAIIRCVVADRPWLFATNTDLESLLNYIHKYKPTSGTCPPSILFAISNALEQHPGRWDISSLQAVFTSGDRFGAAIQRKLIEKLKFNIYQEYGSTEMGKVSTGDFDKDPIYGSAGKLVCEMKLVDLKTEEEITDFNKVGEIRVKGVVMTSYLRNPQSTAAAYDAQGWYMSGDLGYMTENGDLFVVDRVKEMLKYKGFQVAPTELEEILKVMPGVADVAVGGKNDDVAGSLITALVVKKPGWDIAENDVKNFLEKKNLHDSKKLRGGVIFVKQLPKNPNSKLQRRSIAKMLNSALI